ncbi:CoA ester lyase [Aurantimonas sp. MSK8Z-1]|uniref:HpcH/HpaI aldolase/citrate lyase family protein n=1 Tax=Mangrovibrevibacter kandeliae TaxID=2968473 RepID=UPI0021172F28|nr:CoA ester lyase [Aurantimonas sp. MSK8Z-1]MCW4116459.1 CoA ester lyase [Aurantimonas sp. MSK8Z-1]
MPHAPLLCRSALFVPAANPRALEKSASLAADALIFDLEDSAAPEAKAAARARLVAHLGTARPSGLRVVRINALDGEDGQADLAAIGEVALDAILLPKVERPDTVADAAAALFYGARKPAFWAMIETPRGILEAPRIAEAGLAHGLSTLVVGPNDIALATGVSVSAGRPELVPWLMQILLAARSTGLAVLDGVYNDFRDAEGFAAECRQARRLGFDGKTLIHPTQLEPANAAFAPSPEEVAGAQRIADAFAAPENAGRGVIEIDGRMVERLHLVAAEQILARHDAITNREDPA